MKKIYSILAFFAAMTVIAACNKDIEPEPNHAGLSGFVTISASIPDGGLTRVSLEQDSDPDGIIKLAWEKTDKIVVKNAADESKSVTFTLKEGEGTKTAKFTAGDDSALDGATAYKIELSSNLPGDYNIQTQAADASTAHLGYSAVLSGVNKYDSVSFSKEWAEANGSGSFASSSILRLRAKMPSHDIANSVQKVTIKSNKDLFDGYNTLEINITTPGVVGDIVTVYASLPAQDVAVSGETKLLVQFQTSAIASDKYTAYRELGGMNLFAGKVNAINLSCVNVDKFANDTDVNIGTQYNPYFIGDKHQMQAMRGFMEAEKTKYFKLVDDVDLKGIAWQSLNNADPYNKGISFDGDGHTISNLSASSDYAYPSFVGVLDGEVNNVVFDNATIDCADKKGGVVCGYMGHKKLDFKGNCTGVVIRNSTVTSEGMAGGMAAQGDNVGVISKCSILKTSVTSTGARVGGFIGSLVAFDEISDSYAENISITSGSYYNGGIVGQLDGGGKVKGCHSSGSINQTAGTYFRSGGLIGYVINGHVEKCYSTCTITAVGYYVGGLLGQIKDGSVVRSYASGALSTSSGNTGQIGGLVGIVENGSTVSISNCYSQCSMTAGRRCGGLIGKNEGSPSITNCYSIPTFACNAPGGLIGWNGGSITSLSGYIAWTDAAALAGYGTEVPVSEGNYLGTDGTISAHATEFGWSTDIWNLSGKVPTLK